MSRGIVHADPHPYAGEVVPLLMKDSQPGVEKPAARFRIEDWADRVYGQPWRAHRSLAVLIFSARAQGLGLPEYDDRVIYGRMLGLPLLIHTSEIDWSQL